MRAWVLNGIGDMEYRTDVAEPDILDNEVLVAVKAAGVCGSDIPRVYQNGAHRMPLIIGHEFSGQVVKTGKQVDVSWMNQRVGIFPLIPCRNCESCLKGQYEMCRHYSYLGSRQDGGFAEYVAVPVWNLIRLPDVVSFEQAAMMEPMAVAVHAMRRLSIGQEEAAAVFGLGTIGQLLTMFLLAGGIKKVYAIGSKESQREAVTAMGIPERNFCNSSREDVLAWMDSRTKGMGVEAVFECVGKNETVVQSLGMASPGGQICLVGNPYSDMELEKDVYWKILRHQLRVTGTWNSSFLGEGAADDWHYVLDCLDKGLVAPERLITHRFALEDLKCGLDIMRDKTEIYTKIMIKVCGEGGL